MSGPITRVVPVGAEASIVGVQPDPQAAAFVSWAAGFMESLDPWEIDELERFAMEQRR